MNSPRRPGRAADLRLFAGLIVCLCLTCQFAPARAGAAPARMVPVAGPVVRGFDPPAQRWAAGHRGVDLAAPAGEDVRAASDGRVSFVGTIAGVSSVSVRHADGRRTTYQPVEPSVSEGQLVTVGQQIGRLLPGHCEQVCLHWGLLDDEDYLDPLRWLGSNTVSGPIRLLPAGTTVRTPVSPTGVGTGTGRQDAAGAAGPGAAGAATPPVTGPVTSGFGYRTNPIRGTSELHDGIDFGASCGTPVRAAWSGVVSYAAPMSGFGNRVAIDHGTVDGQPLSSSYNHLSDAGVGMVRVGDAVSAGQVIALVGSTGQSTGCHLHFSVYRQGIAVDPQAWLG